ncbi:Alkaline phosphatase synthesis sensor protein PhoR [compost metagenome]
MATLTFTQAGVLMNVVGLAIAMAFAIAINALEPRPFFRAWAWHYVFTIITIASEYARLPVEPYWAYAWPQAIVFWLATHFVCRTAFLLGEIPTPRGYWPAIGVGVVVSLAMLLAGVSFAHVVMLPILASLGAHAYLGLAMWRKGLTSARVTAGCLWFSCVWALLYPVFMNSPLEWMGYGGMGLVHVSIGVGMAVYVLDESQRRVRRQHEELQALDRLKTNFLATVSHELRTPLTVIAGSGQLLQDGEPLSPAQAALVDDMCAHADRLSGLINDLLDFSTMEMGRMRYHPAPTELDLLVAATAEALRPSLERAGIALTVEVPPQTMVATVDGSKIAQVLTNLLTNAAKFTPAGGAVTVRLRRDGGLARLEVQDTGIGLAPDEAQRVFETFYQVDGGPTRQAGGAGLGLAICKQIVEDGHGGRIWVESRPGAGSTFIVTLAVEGALEPADAPRSASS